MRRWSFPRPPASTFGTYKNRLKLAGVKIPTDGSPQGKTAFWSKPLLTPGPGGEQNWRGQPLFPPEIVNKVVAEFDNKGIQIFAHCNGDAAIDMMIDAVRAAGIAADQDRRTIIIHSQFMRPDHLDAFVEFGLSPSYFTEHCYFWGDVHVENTGEERAFFISPMANQGQGHSLFKPQRLLGDADGTHAPDVGRHDPLVAQRQDHRPNERVDAMTALKAMTIDAAWQIREEEMKGTIEAGKLADLVILDADPSHRTSRRSWTSKCWRPSRKVSQFTSGRPDDLNWPPITIIGGYLGAGKTTLSIVC